MEEVLGVVKLTPKAQAQAADFLSALRFYAVSGDSMWHACRADCVRGRSSKFKDTYEFLALTLHGLIKTHVELAADDVMSRSTPT